MVKNKHTPESYRHVVCESFLAAEGEKETKSIFNDEEQVRLSQSKPASDKSSKNVIQDTDVRRDLENLNTFTTKGIYGSVGAAF